MRRNRRRRGSRRRRQLQTSRDWADTLQLTVFIVSWVVLTVLTHFHPGRFFVSIICLSSLVLGMSVTEKVKEVNAQIEEERIASKPRRIRRKQARIQPTEPIRLIPISERYALGDDGELVKISKS